MPGILDRGTQLANELATTVMFGKEIEDAGFGPKAKADLLPALEKAVDLPALQAFNEKCRKWIDAQP